jgi:hypothetical protein
MEVEWEDGTGIRQHWSSWMPTWDSSWYGAEKLLPSSVYDICVRFKGHGPGGPWVIPKVDRHSHCSWVMRLDGTHEEEVIISLE